MKKKNKSCAKDCPIKHNHNCVNPLLCPRCGLSMGLVECFIERESMHFNYHVEPCSEWICACGFSAFSGIITGKFYPYTKITIRK